MPISLMFWLVRAAIRGDQGGFRVRSSDASPGAASGIRSAAGQDSAGRDVRGHERALSW